MNDFFLLKKIDTELHNVLRPVSFFEVNPINIEIEKQKVLKDPDYDPVFQYSEMKTNLDKVEENLHAIDEDDSMMGVLLNDKRNLYIDKSEMLKHRGTKKFSIFARKVYGLPSKNILEQSAAFLNITSQVENRDIDSATAVNMLQAEINHYGFDYNVLRREMSASAFVNVSRRKIFLKINQNFSHKYIRRLTVHEIGTHVLRAENGKMQPFNLFTHGFPNYLATEEGLAVINEERFGFLDNYALKRYAARAIAVRMAQTESFSKIYNYMTEFFSPAAAFKLALRAKRGIEDTSRPGGCPKDYVYIKGYLELKEFIKKNTESGKLTHEDIIKLLYHGKVDLQSLEKLPFIPGLAKPKFLPKNQSFKSLLSF